MEMKRALARRKANEVELVSVILEPCSWKQRAFAKYQVNQPGGKAVTEWAKYNHAFHDVELALSELCEQLRKRP